MAYRVVVIGLGLMGQRMLRSMSPHPGFHVTRVHDVDRSLTRRVADSIDAVACATAPEAMGDVDLVYIATPPSSHLGLIRAAADRGIAVFCEKPLATDVAEAEALVSAVEELGIVSAVNFPFATLPGLERIESDLRSGAVGRVERVEIELHFSQWPRTWHHAGEWLAGRGEGGFLREVFSHFAYLTHRVFGPLSIVDSRVDFGDSQSGDSQPGGLATERRVIAEFECAEFKCAEANQTSVAVTLVGGVGGTAPDFNQWTVFGSKRSYRLQDWSLLQVSRGDRWYDLFPGDSESISQLDALAARLEGRESVLPDLRVGLDVQRVVEGLLAG